MKKLLLLLAATGICGLVSARYIQAAEEPVDLKQEVIQLCEVNAALADQLHIRLDQEEAKSTYDYHSYVMRFFYDAQGRPIEKVPTSVFFLMVGDIISREHKVNAEVVRELLRHNVLLNDAIKNGNRRPFRDEKIK